MPIPQSSAQSLLPWKAFLDHPSYRDLSPLVITYEITNGKPSLVLLFTILTMPTEQIILGIYYPLHAERGGRTQQHIYHTISDLNNFTVRIHDANALVPKVHRKFSLAPRPHSPHRSHMESG